MMKPTGYEDINVLLNGLLAGMKQVLGGKLLALYLYGSLVWGDFDHDISDIDMLAVVADDIDEKELSGLEGMHASFAAANSDWTGRIEVQYLSADGLKTFRAKSSPMAVISPGEPLHMVEADIQWLLNWYFVQEYGVMLFGLPARTFIDPISKQEFITAVKDSALEWRGHMKNTADSRPYQSYAILTLCRAYYSLMHGEQVSKKTAALWTQKEIPEYSMLISDALVWRRDYRKENIDPALTYPAAAGFVMDMIDKIEKMHKH